jgi:signal transduction histidine kinase
MIQQIAFRTLSIAITLLLFACGRTNYTSNVHNAPLADSIVNRAKELMNDGDVEMVSRFVDSAYRSFPKPGTIDLWKKYNLLYKFHLDYLSDTVKVKAYTDSMLSVLGGHEHLYKKQYALTFFALGDLALARRQNNEAFNHYYDGRAYAEKNLDSCSLAQFTSQLAMVRYNQLKFTEAISYFKKAMLEHKACGENNDVDNALLLPQNLYHMIGLSYGQLHDKDSAISYYKMAIKTIEMKAHLFPKNKIAVQAALGEVYGDLGGSYMFQLKNDLATSYLLKSININDRKGYNRYDSESSKIDLAFLNIRAGKFPEAASYISSLDQGLKTLKMKRLDREDIIRNLYKIKKHYFDSTHQLDSAYLYSQKFTTYTDSIKRADKNLQLADMEAAFSVLSLNNENKIKTTYLVAALILIVSIITGLFILLANRKKLKKLNDKIVSQNSDMHGTLKALEQSQRENNLMMKTVVHDLRSPMAATVSISSLLLESIQLNPDDGKMLELLRTSNRNSLEMIENLLNMNATVTELDKEPIEIHTLLDYCVDLLTFKAQEKGQEIILDMVQVTLKVNREKMWRLFSNIIANAIKFSPTKSIIEVDMHRHLQTVHISVKDYGIGISKAQQEKVFDRFTNTKRLGTSGEQSFGLGLSISRQIVEAHQGKIWIESEPGVGTTVHIEFKLDQVD